MSREDSEIKRHKGVEEQPEGLVLVFCFQVSPKDSFSVSFF